MPKTSPKPLVSALSIVSRSWDTTGPMPAAVARHILNVRLPDADVARMHELAARNGEGGITAAELAEYDEYLRACGVLGILHSHARVTLGIKPPTRAVDD